MIHHGDCLDVMAGMEPESLDAIVTDPPYGLGFMGKAWDNAARLASVPPSAVALAETGHDPYPKTGKGPAAVAFDGRAFQGWCERWAEAAFRVAKPSAYLLAFGGTRTVHRMTVALEDAGWIIRDMLVWAYLSGFPKSRASLKPSWEPIVLARKPGPLRELNIEGCRIPFTGTEDVEFVESRIGSYAKRPVWDGPAAINPGPRGAIARDGSGSNGAYSNDGSGLWHTEDPRLHNPSTVLRAWSAERPEADSGPLANALADAFAGRGLLDSRGGYPSCRRCGDGLAQISAAADREDAPLRPDVPGAPPFREWSLLRIRESRCDAHLSTWDELARVVAEGNASASGNDITSPLGRWPANVVMLDPILDDGWPGVIGGGNETSRVFVIPKADRADREPVLGGLPVAVRNITEGHGRGPVNTSKGDGSGIRENRPRANLHPTVKPVDLMRHLVRLVTPTGGTVLDPFAGSGSTLIAAEMEGFAWIGIEREAEYVAIAEARLNGTQRGLGLPA